MASKGKYVLIGNSAASLAAADWIRKFDAEGSILILNREKSGEAYSRVALPYYVAGERRLESILIRRKAEYESLRVQSIENADVASIDPAGHEVRLQDGRTIGYEKLLVGTGSEVMVPPIQGLDQVPHHYLWTLEDAIGMKKAAEKAKRALVIGGGFIGMLTAEALRKLKMDLTIVEMADQLMPQLLDAEGGKIFARAVEKSGVDLRLGSQVQSVASKGKATVVRLKGGDEIETDLLAVAAGVRPCLGFVGKSLKTNQGILVDERLQTSDPDVYAAGDVAEGKDFVEGSSVVHAIWPTAVDQGRIAGANMAGKNIPYAGSLGMNVVTLFGVTLAELGRFREARDDSVEIAGSSSSDHYRKVVIDPKGIMVGAMYLGGPNGVSEMGVIHHAIKRRENWKAFVDQGVRATASYAAMAVRTPVGLRPTAKA